METISEQCIDIILNHTEENTENTLPMLSAPRYFNEDIYKKLVEEFPSIYNINTDYQAVTRYSFVRLLDQPSIQNGQQKFFQVYDFLRHLYFDSKNKYTVEAHKVLANYYYGLGNEIEAIYHNYFFHESKSEVIDRITELFDDARKNNRNQQCDIIVNMRKELKLYDTGNI